MSNVPMQFHTGAILPYTILAGTDSHTITAQSSRNLFMSNPTSARTITIDGLGFKAGEVIRITVEGATENNNVQVIDGTEIDRIGGEGFILLMARIDNPVNAGDWKILQLQEYASMPGVTGTGAVNGAISCRGSRQLMNNARLVHLDVFASSQSAVGSSNNMTASGLLTSRFRPIGVSRIGACRVYNNSLEEPGTFSVTTAGSVALQRSGGAVFSGTVQMFSQISFIDRV